MSSFTDGLKYKPTGTYSKFGLPEYELLEGFSYRVGSLDNPVWVISVPKGFVTDFASIPFPISIWLKPTGPWAKAGALHDWLYRHENDISKVIKDAIFYEACLVLKVNHFIAWAFFTILRIVQPA